MIDVSHWKRDEKSYASGTRSKFWLCEPTSNTNNSTKYLFKIPTEGTGGHWAEFIASTIGMKLGFDTVEVKLAKHQGTVGTISKNFRTKVEEFYEGGDLFLAQFENFDRYSLTYYELPNIIDILTPYNLEKEFIALPIFDALIANNDRHCDNWGVLSGPKGIHLAPIYDNGSSLGFNETMDRKQKMLTDDHMLAAFCNRGRPCIGLPSRTRPKHFELLTYLHHNFPNELQFHLSRLNELNKGMILSIIDEIPYHIMSDLDKKWVIRLLLYRKDWLLNWLERRIFT